MYYKCRGDHDSVLRATTLSLCSIRSQNSEILTSWSERHETRPAVRIQTQKLLRTLSCHNPR